MRRAEGFDWAGDAWVRVRPGPGGAGESPGWTRVIGAGLNSVTGPRSFSAGAAQGLGVALVLIGVVSLPYVDPDDVMRALLACQLALLGAMALDHLLARVPRRPLYVLRWDADGVTLERGGRAAHVPTGAIAEVVWEAQPWYGAFARRPLALGANLVVRRHRGEDLLAGRGLDGARLRALGERLACDLGVPMREILPEVGMGSHATLPDPVVRTPAELDRPLTAASEALPPPKHQLRFASWAERATPRGHVLTLAAGLDVQTLLTHLFAAENVLLPPLLAYDFVRFGVLSVVQGPRAMLTNWLAAGVVEVVLHLIVGGSFAYGFWRTARPRRVVVDRLDVVVEVAGVVVGRMPLAALEQVRAETFPVPAVRLVGDGLELLIDDLPSVLDAEWLADRLPRLLREQAPGPG